MSRAENHTSRNCLKGHQLAVGLVKMSRQNVLTSLDAMTIRPSGDIKVCGLRPCSVCLSVCLSVTHASVS